MERGRPDGSATGGDKRVSPLVACDYCPGKIRFAHTFAGQLIPVEPERVALWLLKGWRAPGAVTVVDDAGHLVRGHPIRQPSDTELPNAIFVEGYLPHFGNCKDYPGKRR